MNASILRTARWQVMIGDSYMQPPTSLEVAPVHDESAAIREQLLIRRGLFLLNLYRPLTE